MQQALANEQKEQQWETEMACPVVPAPLTQPLTFSSRITPHKLLWGFSMSISGIPVDSNFETMNNDRFQFDLRGSRPGSRAAELACDRSYQYAAGTAQ